MEQLEDREGIAQAVSRSVGFLCVEADLIMGQKGGRSRQTALRERA